MQLSIELCGFVALWRFILEAVKDCLGSALQAMGGLSLSSLPRLPQLLLQLFVIGIISIGYVI
jgi:hypothetical protein